jgi:hypothetical protein
MATKTALAKYEWQPKVTIGIIILQQKRNDYLLLNKLDSQLTHQMKNNILLHFLTNQSKNLLIFKK